VRQALKPVKEARAEAAGKLGRWAAASLERRRFMRCAACSPSVVVPALRSQPAAILEFINNKSQNSCKSHAHDERQALLNRAWSVVAFS